MFSDLVYPAATVYPDSDKIGIWTDRDKTDSHMARRADNLDYYDGEVYKKRSRPAGGPLLGEERYCFHSRYVRCEQMSPGRPSPSVPG